MNTVLSVQASVLHAIESSNHSVSNHPPSSPCDSLVLRTTGLTAATLLPKIAPTGDGVIWASPLGGRLATTTGRIEFVIILRTNCSPPVASHPASRRRSYVRLQSSDQTLTRTLTSRIRSTRTRTPHRAPLGGAGDFALRHVSSHAAPHRARLGGSNDSPRWTS